MNHYIVDFVSFEKRIVIELHGGQHTDNLEYYLAFVDQFYDKLYTLDDTKLSADQKVTLNLTLEKLRNMVYQKMKLLKV